MNRNLSRLARHGALWLSIVALCVIQLTAELAHGKTAGQSTAISSAIIDQIQSRWKLNNANYQIEITRIPFLAVEFDTPGAFDSIAITPLTRKRPRGAYPMLIDIYREGRSFRHGQGSAFVSVYDSILVADSRASKGTLASDLLLHLSFEETTNMPDAYITNIADLDGMRLRRNLQRGEALTRSRLEPIPDVDFGQEVSIEYTGGGLTLSATGFALQKGVIGETVRVRNVSSKKIIRAVVAGPGMVRITSVGGQRRTR